MTRRVTHHPLSTADAIRAAGVGPGGLYAVFCELADCDTGASYYSLGTLAERMGVSRSTATAWRNALVDAGLIRVRARVRGDGGQTSSLVTVLGWIPPDRHADTPPDRETDTPCSADRSPPDRQAGHEPGQENQDKRSPPPPSAPERAQEEGEDTTSPTVAEAGGDPPHPQHPAAEGPATQPHRMGGPTTPGPAPGVSPEDYDARTEEREPSEAPPLQALSRHADRDDRLGAPARVSPRDGVAGAERGHRGSAAQSEGGAGVPAPAASAEGVGDGRHDRSAVGAGPDHRSAEIGSESVGAPAASAEAASGTRTGAAGRGEVRPRAAGDSDRRASGAVPARRRSGAARVDGDGGDGGDGVRVGLLVVGGTHRRRDDTGGLSDDGGAETRDRSGVHPHGPVAARSRGARCADSGESRGDVGEVSRGAARGGADRADSLQQRPTIPLGHLRQPPVVADGVVEIRTARDPGRAIKAALLAVGYAYVHDRQAWVSGANLEAAVAAARVLCPWWSPEPPRQLALLGGQVTDLASRRQPKPERRFDAAELRALDAELRRRLGPVWRGGTWRVRGQRAELAVDEDVAPSLDRWTGVVEEAVEAVTGEALHVVVRARGCA